MHPVLLRFPFLGTGLLACALISFALTRGPLQARLGRRGIALAALIAALVAAVAGASGLVAWRGDLVLTSYAAALIAGFAAAVALAIPRMRARGMDPEHLRPMTLIMLVLGMIGSRARYAWENPAAFRHADGGIDVRKLLDLDAGGMVWYGGLMLGAVGIAIYTWRQRLNFLAVGDAMLPTIAVGLGIGRVGCFFNGCCYGGPSSLPWAVISPHPPHQAIHPTQLYETLAGLILGAGLMLIDRLRPPRGMIAAGFCIGYGAWRCFNESLRTDYRHAGTVGTYLGIEMTNSQVTSVLLVAVGLGLAMWAWLRRSPDSATQTPSP